MEDAVGDGVRVGMRGHCVVQRALVLPLGQDVAHVRVLVEDEAAQRSRAYHIISDTVGEIGGGRTAEQVSISADV